MFLSVAIGLVYTPIMLRLLGKSEYGLYSTVSSTISMLSILSLGLGSGYIRYFAKYKAVNDEVSISKLNGLYLQIFSIIGCIAFGCGLFLSNNLRLVFAEGLSDEEYGIARVLMVLLTVNLSISFPMTVFTNIITAHERFIFLKLVGVLRTVISPLLTLPLLLMGFRSIAMVGVTVTISVITDAVYLFYVFFRLNSKFLFHDYESGLLKNIFIYCSFVAINIVIDQINWNIDKIILGRYRGTVDVSIYSVGFIIYTYYQMLSTALIGNFTPRVHKLFNSVENNWDTLSKEMTDLFIKVGRLQFIILALVASGFCVFGRSFIHIWAGADYDESFYVALLLMLPASIALIQNLGIEIQRAENKHQFRSIIYVVMALCNLILSIHLGKKYGAIGSSIGTAVSLILANGFIMNWYYHRRCGIKIDLFWINIGRLSSAMIIPIIAGIIINYRIRIESFGVLLFVIIVYTTLYCTSMWLLGMNHYEKQLIIDAINKLRNKRL